MFNYTVIPPLKRVAVFGVVMRVFMGTKSTGFRGRFCEPLMDCHIYVQLWHSRAETGRVAH